MADFNKKTLMPFTMTALVIILDQISKIFIAANWPQQDTLIKDVFNNEFLFLCHVRNKAIAFSLGDTLPAQFRYLVFVIVPVAVLVFLVWYYFATKEFNALQRWVIAGIIGGGVGNIIDRMFRPDGVIDFISVKFYGLFGMERWPTFNLADSSVVLCCIVLFITLFWPKKVLIHSYSESDPEDNLVHEDNLFLETDSIPDYGSAIEDDTVSEDDLVPDDNDTAQENDQVSDDDTAPEDDSV